MAQIYPLNLAGESNYQEAVTQCCANERVYVCHEPDNPFDARALKVETAGGQTLGYIPKSSWLRDAIHEQGRGVIATIRSVGQAQSGLFGIILDVTLSDDELRLVFYEARAA